MKKFLFLTMLVIGTFVYSCTESEKSATQDVGSLTTEERSVYNCVEQYKDPGCVNLNLPDVTVQIPGYPFCFITIRQNVYRCPNEYLFGETYIVAFGGDCQALEFALNPKNWNGTGEWEVSYLNIKAALNKAAMEAHLATLLPPNSTVSATLIEAACFKACPPVNGVISTVPCGFGCCKKHYTVTNGQATFTHAIQLSPCTDTNLCTNGLGICIMNCN